MKQILYLCCLVLLLSCGKEEAIKPTLTYDNVFEIKDDPNDPIQHRIYNIYQKYKVPVYFNDTIGKVYIMDDVQGNPVYNVEKIDLAWTFHGYAKQKYEYTYMHDVRQKMKALTIIEDYLSSSSPSLYPFSFFVSQSGQKTDQGKLIEEYKNGTFVIGFRTLYMTGNWTSKQETELPDLMRRQMILEKMLNYPVAVADFSTVSKPTWYGGLFWSALDPSIQPAVWKGADPLYDDWFYAKDYTAEELELLRVEGRKVIGRFGFVKGNKLTKGLHTPQNATDDLRDYIQEMLTYRAEVFQEKWGNHPLVMKKYTILKTVIAEKMHVKL